MLIKYITKIVFVYLLVYVDPKIAHLALNLTSATLGFLQPCASYRVKTNIANTFKTHKLMARKNAH